MGSKKYGYMATIGADTSGLTSALQTVDSEAKKISSELREINNNLKFEDGGAVALQQKYDLLQQAIEQTTQKLEMLRSAEADVNAAAEAGTISEANQRSYQRELDSTANKLTRYQKEAEKTSEAIQALVSGQETANNVMQTSEEIADIVSKAMQRYSDSAKSAAESNEAESKSLDGVEESAEKASEALKKVALSNNLGYDQSAIDYIENFGKKSEEALSAYDKYKNSVGEANEAIKQAESEYNNLNKMLASNADNQVLAAQKNEIKNQLIEAETYKLNKLNQQYNAMKQSFNNGDIGAEQFREFQREVEQTKIKLGELQKSEENAAGAAKDYKKAIKDAGQQTVTFGDILKANIASDLISSGINKIKDGVTDFVQQGIQLAFDLTEVQNVVDVTFGSGAQEIYDWADAAAESFGMSSLAAQEYNGTMGAMLKSMGLTDDKVREMSMDMVGLAGDMASFYNLDVETAFTKIRSGISGETEPLKQLGINMSVANLEAYALSQGIKTAYKEMTEAEKATLRYNYLMAQTADAQGDFARTSDSFANQQKILELQTQNLAASFGEKLLPMVNDLTGTLNENMPSIGDKIEDVGDIVVGLFDFVIDHHEAILSVITGIGTALAAQKGAKVLGDVTGAAENLFSTVKSGQGVMSALAASLNTQPWVLAVGAIAAVTMGLIALAKAANEADSSLKENAEESVRKYEEQSEKVSGLETELKEVRDRIEEIKAKGKLTLTDEDELALLQKKNDKLSGQLEIEKEILETKRQQKALDSAELANSSEKKSGSVANVEAALQEYERLEKEMTRNQNVLKVGIQEKNTKWINEAEEEINRLEKEMNDTKLKILEDTDVLTELSENLDTTTEAGKEAAAAITKLKTEVSSKFGIPVTENAEKEIEASETYGEYMKRKGEEQEAENKRRREERLADYEKNLKAKKEELDNNLALRRISEEEYYQQIGEYLAENKNLSSKEYFELLGKYENYLDKKQKAADKAAEDEQKAEKERQKAAKKAVEDAETERVNAIKASWDKITRMHDRGEITDEAEYKAKAQIVKEYCDENEATWDSYYKWLYDYTKKQEDEIADIRLKAWEDNSKKLSDTLAESYKNLKSQKEQVKKELQSIDLTETVKDKDGNDILVLKDLDAEIKKIDKLKASREKLKATGISESLMAEIDKMSYADGSRQRYIDELLSLSPEKLQLYYQDWEKWQAKQEEFAQDSVSDQLDDLNAKAAEGVKDIFGNIPKEAYEDGIETARQYLQGVIDGMGDLDSAAALRLGGIADRAAVRSNPEASSVDKMLACGALIPAESVIKLFVNDKNFIQMTVGEMFNKGRITGENPFGT